MAASELKGFARFRERVDCHPYEPNDVCGGCDRCMSAQFFWGIHRDRQSLEDIGRKELLDVLHNLGVWESDDTVHTDTQILEAAKMALDGKL